MLSSSPAPMVALVKKKHWILVFLKSIKNKQNQSNRTSLQTSFAKQFKWMVSNMYHKIVRWSLNLNFSKRFLPLSVSVSPSHSLRVLQRQCCTRAAVLPNTPLPRHSSFVVPSMLDVGWNSSPHSHWGKLLLFLFFNTYDTKCENLRQ